MQNKFTETNPRQFNPTLVPGLSAEGRKAVNAVFDAMSSWRTETASNSERNIEQVIEKWLRLLGHWDGRSKLLMPPVRNWKVLPKCRFKPWIT